MSNGSGYQSHSANIALDILEIFLQQPNVQVDVCDRDGRQPLLWAASAGAVKAVLVMLHKIRQFDFFLVRIQYWFVHKTDRFPLQMLVKAGARVESADKYALQLF